MSYEPYDVAEARSKYEDAKSRYDDANNKHQIAIAELELARLHYDIAMDGYPDLYKPRSQRGW